MDTIGGFSGYGSANYAILCWPCSLVGRILGAYGEQVKDSSKKALGRSLLDYDYEPGPNRNRSDHKQLTTHVFISCPRGTKVLTHAPFLYGKRLMALPHSQTVAVAPSSHTELLKTLIQHQETQKDFWNHWYKEYLILLRSAHSRPMSDITSIAEGIASKSSWHDPTLIPTSSATSRTVKRWFPRITVRTLSTWSLSVDVEGRPG